ncbi:helicase POLQ-like [Asbolus verrucosus]|uniref:Helicase POLQ-like n=1 Tax=Asbolus verrucosus TaxID=1661398 RepID=A0A482WDG3_ASBVE|nr:helicase POLQ-like [Asbolus verrucosus]
MHIATVLLQGTVYEEVKKNGVKREVDNSRTLTGKKFKNDLSFMEDTFDNIDDTQILMNKNETSASKTVCIRSISDSFLETKPTRKKEFDAFQSYLNSETEKPKMSELSQFFKSSQVINQIESVLSNENRSVHVAGSVLKERNSLDTKPKTSTEKSEHVFNDSSREEIGHFFDQIEQSISMMDVNVENRDDNLSKVLEMLLNTQASVNQAMPLNQKEDLQASISQINASFASALKQVFLANASKDVSNAKISNVPTVQPSNVAKFTEMGPFYGLPLKVKELIKLYRGIEELYDWQDECLKLPAVQRRKNLIYALPTSGGKTLVAEILMLRELICSQRNALFILPYVAIVQEKVWGLSPFAVALDFLVEEYAASKGVYPPRKRRRKNSIFIATIEKALGLLNSLIETERISEIGLIVVDELHLVGESGRGSTLEALLTKIMFIKADIQIVGMSATIGNITDLSTFLNAEIYTQNFRPVELIEYVKCGPEVAKINWSKGEEELFTVTRRVDYSHFSTFGTLDPDGLGVLVTEVVPKDSCLIFCPSKKNCENVANLLCRVLDKDLCNYKKEEKEQVKHALKDETGSLCKIFNVSIQYGIAYHHSGLTNEERRVIEDAFRAGVISVICCTSTLAAGVNLPAKRVILRKPYVGREFISLSKYKQMVGRAGRAGLGETGDSILICNNQDLAAVKKLLTSPMDKTLSNMNEAEGRGLRHLLLSCIYLGIANTRPQLQEVSKKTLLNIQSDRLGINVKKLTDRVISDLFKLGNFDLTRAHMVYDDLHQAQRSLVLLDSLHLLYLVTPYEIAEQIKPNKNDYYNIYCKLGANELQTARILGLVDSVALKMLSNQPIKNVPERVLNRFYLTLMLHDLWNEKSVFAVSEKFQVNRGVVQNLMTNAATFASNVVYFCEGLEEFWTFAYLIKGMSQRLSHCCVRELLPLMELPAVKQSRAKQLYKAGYKTLQSIAKADVETLVESIEFMPQRVAKQLIAAAKMLLLEKVENLREEAEDVMDGVVNPKPFTNETFNR